MKAIETVRRAGRVVGVVVVAALAAGNAVLAKPAEQTPLIAARAPAAAMQM